MDRAIHMTMKTPTKRNFRVETRRADGYVGTSRHSTRALAEAAADKARAEIKEAAALGIEILSIKVIEG